MIHENTPQGYYEGKDSNDQKPDEGLAPQPMSYQKPVMSVGTEAVAWAETYWNFEEMYKVYQKSLVNGEACSYEYFKKCFIEHIDKTISVRVTHYL